METKKNKKKNNYKPKSVTKGKIKFINECG